MSIDMLPVRRVWPFLLVATVATLALYWPSLSFDLYADDYLYLRPWSLAELRAAWFGPWLPFPTAPPFYRPITTTMYTGLFALFGVNSAALHWIAMPVMIAAASLVGLHASRTLGDERAGWFGTLLFVLFPGSVTSMGPWIVNQYHGLLVIWCTGAWLLWPSGSSATWRRWAGILLLVVAAGWTKEDGLLLPLALVAGHVVAAWWSRTTPMPSTRMVVAALVVFAALFVWRLAALGTFGGYPWWPPPDQMLLNLARGLAWIPLVQLGPLPAAAVATLFTVTLCLLGAWRAWHTPHAAESRLFVFGAVAFVVFLLPHTLMSSITRGHLLSLAAVTFLTAAAAPWLRSGRLPRTALALGVAALAVVSQTRLQAFAVCSEEARFELGWVVPDVKAFGPPELASWLEGLHTCPTGTPRRLTDEVESLTWGLTAPSPTLVVLAHADAAAVRWSVSADTTQTVTLHVDGQTARSIEVGPETRVIEIPLRPTWRTSLRRMHRLDIVAATPTQWTSSVVIVRRPAAD